MKYPIVLFLALFFSYSAFAQQDKYNKHKVEKGETVIDIAKKYKVTPYDIYRMNPDSQNGIKENTILLIPVQSKKENAKIPDEVNPTKITNTIHEVQPKETLSSLSRKYNVSVNDIKKINGDAVENGLQIGQKVIIPIKGNPVTQQVQQAKEDIKKASGYLFHTVEAGETKYSIAKQYGMTLQLLEELNPEVKETLPLGYKLKLDKKALVAKETQEISVVTIKQEDYIIYTVQPKETFYSLTRRFDITEEKIIALNPDAKNGLKEGMELRLPKEKANIELPIVKSDIIDLSKSLKKSSSKELVLLLPFNVEKYSGTEALTQEILSRDKFLNMTLDFYAGALMAIDSAKVMGLPIEVKILDSKETKNTSAIEELVSQNKFANSDAIIGPFIQSYVERTAELLQNKNIPVISPLSKEAVKPYSNLYQSIPSTERTKIAMLNYLKFKNGNVIAIVDPRKTSSKNFIKDNYSNVKFARFEDSGKVSEIGLKGLLVKDRVNYVILESERLEMVLNTTKILNNALTDFSIQLVVLEKTELLDSDELPLSRLTNLKMLYPSVTRDNETPESIIFAKAFKNKNNIFPNQYATRGFDVTFDVILRLFQPESFKDAMNLKTSQQMENKFNYELQNDGNYNNGVYILHYNDDLTVKEAQ